MKTMTVRGSPIFRNLLVAAAVVILVFGLKYSSDVLAPIFLAATLAILFTPTLWWLDRKTLLWIKSEGAYKVYCMILFLGLYYSWQRNKRFSENTWCNMTVCYS